MARRRWNLNTIEQVVNGENPFIQIGYNTATSGRKEGEIWTDSKGKKWQKINGHKKALNSTNTPLLDEIKKFYICKCCGADTRFSSKADARLNEKVIGKTGLCYDCLEKEELLLRLNGKWDSYEQLKVTKNHLCALEEFKNKVLESIEYLRKDTGKVVDTNPITKEAISFTGKCNPQWLLDAENDLDKVTKEIDKVTIELNELKSKVEN